MLKRLTDRWKSRCLLIQNIWASFGLFMGAAAGIVGTIYLIVFLTIGYTDLAWVIAGWCFTAGAVLALLGAIAYLMGPSASDYRPGRITTQEATEQARRSVEAWDLLFRHVERTAPGPDATTEEVLAWSKQMDEARENMQRDLKARRDAGL